MTESPRLPVMPSNNEGRMGLEQNIFDQPELNTVYALAPLYGSEDMMQRVSSMMFIQIANTMRRLKGLDTVAPLGVIAKELSHDTKFFIETIDTILQNQAFLRRLQKFLEGYRVSPDVSSLLLTLVSNIEQPILKTLYVDEHKYMYKGNGTPIQNRFNAITAPLTYDAWLKQMLPEEKNYEDPDPYAGLHGHLSHLGYNSQPFVPTNSDRSLNHYVKGATPLI